VVVFTPEKLRRLGDWCVSKNGGGQFWCEEVSGGLPIVERG